MQRELFIRNAEIAGALGEIQRLYDILDRDLQQAKTLQRSRWRRFGWVLQD